MRRFGAAVVLLLSGLLVASCTKSGAEMEPRDDGIPVVAEAAQRAYYHRAKMNGAARTGMYAPEMETAGVA